jgi:hypothetical protein
MPAYVVRLRGVNVGKAPRALARQSIEPFEVLFDVADCAALGHWRWGASLHDIANTVAWPLILYFLARYTRLMSPRATDDG